MNDNAAFIFKNNRPDQAKNMRKLQAVLRIFLYDDVRSSDRKILNLSFAFLNRFRDYILYPFSQKSKRFFCRFMYFEHFSPIAQKSIVFM